MVHPVLQVAVWLSLQVSCSQNSSPSKPLHNMKIEGNRTVNIVRSLFEAVMRQLVPTSGRLGFAILDAPTLVGNLETK
ncbi:hypothetical protein B0H12DRAFT_1150821 [Mycena haematopus]|nr:hypothetical protein B0H12DRAFT_1151695 [Mycena haematopus]KAJ7222989.1 hypothetical protein B0H12DRAFT_1150821 [Mycena haematopus]